LNRAELAAVAVVLHIGKGPDHGCIAADPANAPADHVVTLAQGINLNTHILGPGEGKEAEGWLIVRQHRMRRVLDNDKLVPLGQRDHLLIKFARRRFSSRAVGIVKDEQLRLLPDIRRDRIEIGEEVFLCSERQAEDAAAVIPRVSTGHGIAGDRHQRDVARIDEAGG
jgi:hypothetical protein